MEYVKCNFSNKKSRNERRVRMDDIEIDRSRSFWLIGFIIQDTRKIIEDITHRIKD